MILLLLFDGEEPLGRLDVRVPPFGEGCYFAIWSGQSIKIVYWSQIQHISTYNLRPGSKKTY